MRALMSLAAVAAIAVPVATATTSVDAQTAPPAPATTTTAPAAKPKPPCLVTQVEFRSYARAVYHRSTVSKTAQRALDRRRACSSSKKASKNMLRYQRAQSSSRQVRLTAYCGSQACNRNLARILAGKRYGPGGFACLDGIIMHESKYRTQVYNYGGSGAYGIPQALPGSKMASHGRDWATSATTQLRWMFSYVDSRYGGPCNALAYWRGHRSY